MFQMEGEGSLDQLRGILVYSIKEAVFRKVKKKILRNWRGLKRRNFKIFKLFLGYSNDNGP